ncbi:hypothetical protein [Streptomyces sp. NPDC049887]|uniref:hypothetical protein n=1 Tax=Streptomyces sp. NPDC049887 TaxID=3155654 RepID=UPI00341E8D6D
MITVIPPVSTTRVAEVDSAYPAVLKTTSTVPSYGTTFALLCASTASSTVSG